MGSMLSALATPEYWRGERDGWHYYYETEYNHRGQPSWRLRAEVENRYQFNEPPPLPNIPAAPGYPWNNFNAPAADAAWGIPPDPYANNPWAALGLPWNQLAVNQVAQGQVLQPPVPQPVPGPALPRRWFRTHAAPRPHPGDLPVSLIII
jgi:hypothetical protein